MAKAKIFLVSIVSIIVLICSSIIIWYLSVCRWGNDKKVSKTFYVDELTLSDGSSRNFIEVEYFANKDGSGYEALEINYTYFMDESRENTYSQGLQYIAQGSSIEFGGTSDILFTEKQPFRTEGALFWKEKYYRCQVSTSPLDSVDFYNYMYNGYEYVKSTNSINNNTCFKINIGDDIYLMEFKGANEYDNFGNLIENTPINDDMYCGRGIQFNDFSADIINFYYCVYDVHYFSQLIYETIKTSSLGLNGDYVFEYGNLFNYYKYNPETGKYDNNRTNYDDAIKLEADIKSYYSIRVKTHEKGLTNSNDSMFGSILGNQNFNLNGDYSSGDYFVGSTIVNVGINDFYLVPITESHVALKLNDDFVDYYSKYKNSIKLSIVIDIDILSSVGYEFKGFTVDSNLDKFKIYECYTVSGGIKVDDINIQEVIYE